MHTSRDMSTHKSIKTSLERAKTSLGLKSSNRERMESVSELMMALESERQLEQVMMNSVEKWTEIVDEITTNMDSATTSESEWKTRFHDQRLFNQMLTKEIGQIKTELYMLKQGDAGMTLPVMGESESSSSSNSRQSQVYIKSLEEKLKSLESLYNMYEHQLDDASRDYHRLKEEINKIVKDVSYKQKAMIKRQEESDQRKIAKSNLAIKLLEKETTLPPLKGLGGREKMSYLKLHEEKSVTSKPIGRGKNPQPWKGVEKLTKLPSINNSKNNEKTSKKTKETYVVQEEWKRVTKKDLLHPIWSANNNREEDHQSNVAGKGHVKKNNKTDADPKLPSMRSRRIVNLGAVSDGVTLPAIRKGRKAKTNPGATKERPDTHKDYVRHVDDQRAGSTKASKDNDLCGLSRRPSTKTTITTASRNSERNVYNGENKTVANKSQHKRKLDPVSKSTKKTLPEVVASHQQHNATERHEYQFPVDNDGPISKPSTKRLKSAFVRSNSTSSRDDGKQNVSPIELQVSPSKEDSQISVVYKDSMSPINVTTDDRVNMAEDTSEIEAGRNSSEHFVNSTEKATKDPETKRKSVTINDRTTIHFP